MSYKWFFLLAAAVATRNAAAQAPRPPSEAATAEQRLAEDIGTEQLPGLFAAAAREARHVSTLLQLGASQEATVTQQGSLGNQAYVVQAGAANVLGLRQVGGGNEALMTQQGLGNWADATQEGQENTLVVQQRGVSNRAQSLIAGTDNTLTIRQDGSYNAVQSELRQNDRTYTISQSGYNNTLTQKETTAQSPPGYTVEMRGVGITMTIEQGNVVR